MRKPESPRAVILRSRDQRSAPTLHEDQKRPQSAVIAKASFTRVRPLVLANHSTSCGAGKFGPRLRQFAAMGKRTAKAKTRSRRRTNPWTSPGFAFPDLKLKRIA